MYLKVLFLFSKVENILSDFSSSSRKWGKEFQSSLSLLQIGEKNFKFLFLFSIGLFGLSSMPDTEVGKCFVPEQEVHVAEEVQGDTNIVGGVSAKDGHAD